MKRYPYLFPFPRIVRFTVLGALGLLGAGCSIVSVPRPAGDQPHALVVTEWEGTWLNGRDPAKVKVADALNGGLQLTVIEEHDGKFALKTIDVSVRESGELLVASLRDESRPEFYVWALLRRSDDFVLVWIPDGAKFRELVRQGKLKGRIDGDDVHLEVLTAENLRALTSGEYGTPFQKDSPLIFRRVAP